MSPTFKQFLQDKTFNADFKKKYQKYDVKIIIAFHNQAMTKNKIYKDILAWRTGMYYSPGIRFETSLFSVNEEKSLTKIN